MQKCRKHTTRNKPMTSWVCSEISQSWVSRSRTSACVHVLFCAAATLMVRCGLYVLMYLRIAGWSREADQKQPTTSTLVKIVDGTRDDLPWLTCLCYNCSVIHDVTKGCLEIGWSIADVRSYLPMVFLCPCHCWQSVCLCQMLMGCWWLSLTPH